MAIKRQSTGNWLKNHEAKEVDFYFKTEVRRYTGLLKYTKFCKWDADEDTYICFNMVTKGFNYKFMQQQLKQIKRNTIAQNFFARNLIIITKKEFEDNFKKI